jgi:NADH:ubiquinone oxidoreductase subunit F (NADH-binding)
MYELTSKWVEGEGSEGDLELMEALANNMAISSRCGLGQFAGTAFLTSYKLFADEYRAHVNGGKCPSGICEMQNGGGKENG